MIVPRYYENLNILHENTMPNRSYYIPASSRMDTLVDNRETSDRFQLLSGNWKFRYYDSIYNLKEEFFAADFEASGFDNLPVPSVWQMHGYDSHHYINSRYPFPADPPYVPHDNPCGAYFHTFTYHKDNAAPNAFLNFEGVDSCFYVWLNGKYVGYSQVAHSTSEFDVTEHLHEGENKLAVLVLKWCDGSYLECQDKFRWNGIFRDVYLLKRPKTMLWDYFVHTTLGSDSVEVAVEAKPSVPDACVRVSIYDAGNTLIATAVAEETENGTFSQCARLTVKNPVLWNAEQPYLYTLVLETDGETITDSLGLREICIRDSVVYLNGVAVKFHGVNRHESDPVTGYTVGIEQMKKELQLLKAHNFNAVRTSHYPSHPVFYQLCDRYGFYVIDEADVEAHGAQHAWFKGEISNGSRWNEMVADAPEFVGSIVDRIQRLVIRDKNRPCAVIWSMGNESAYGRGFETALAWTKQYDPSRLTHYESAKYVNSDHKYDYSNLDLWSEMYASIPFMKDYIAKNPDKPFVQCEYSHAMGNGPGDLEDYFQTFYSDPRFCGGFVWEFCDHAVFKGYAENGKAMYAYGGDHNETVNDGNFCMDGLVYPDRTPHTGMLEFKNIHRPVRAAYDQDGAKLHLTSYLAFVNLRDYLDMTYEVSCDGNVIEQGRVEVPSVLPRSTAHVPFAVKVPEKGKCFLNLSYTLKKATELLPAGHALGFDQICLSNADGRNQDALSASAARTIGKLEIAEDDVSVTVTGTNFVYIYSKRTGLWESLTLNGKVMMEKPMELNIWRAPTDNDRNIKLKWMLAKHQYACARAYDSAVTQENGIVRIANTMSVGALTTRPVVRLSSVWTVDAAGRIGLEMEGQRNPEYLMIPRFGLRMFLPESMTKVTYCGVGPYESYCDKHHASHYGRFDTSVAVLHEDYLRPQENGSHWGCDYLVISGEAGKLTVSAQEETFSFNASPYTQEELMEKNHNYELEPSGCTVLCLDYRHNGIGSNSCGPVLASEYALGPGDFKFALHITPEA